MFLFGNNFITFDLLRDAMKYSELFRLLKINGWFLVRQSGSHVIMAHPEKPNKIVIPFHASKEVKKGLLSSILKDADIEIKKR